MRALGRLSLAELTEPLAGKILVVAKKGKTAPNKTLLEDNQNVEESFPAATGVDLIDCKM